MNHTQLRAFDAVARSGSFTRAARSLHVTQPTLSAQVKALEGEHDVQLFDRSRRRVQLTELGRALHGLTHALFELEEQARQLLAAARGLRRGYLRVGADAPAHVMSAVASFSRLHPGVRLTVDVGNSRQVQQALMEERTDLAVVADVEPDERLFVRELQSDRVVLVVGRGHRWARRRSVRLAELQGEPLVTRERGSTTRAIVERHLEAEGVTAGAALEITSREGVREAVAAGLGVGAVFEAELGHDPRLHKVGIADADLRGVEQVICLRARRRHAVVDQFIRVLTAGAAP